MEEKLHPDIAYIKTEEIGQIISQGLTAVYLERPDFPVDYLAKWLLNYCRNIDREKELEAEMIREKEIKAKWAIIAKEEALKEKAKADQAEAERLRYENLRLAIQENKYKEKLLKSEFANFLRDFKDLTGCYIGIYE